MRWISWQLGLARIAVFAIGISGMIFSARSQAPPSRVASPSHGAPKSQAPATQPTQQRRPAAPRQAIPAPPSGQSSPGSHFVVVLDAAHGGDDSGGHLSDGQFEKAATLALSVRLRSLLNARGIQVVTTRESDQSVDMNQRAAIANRANAQACISLHVAETGSGLHLFASNLAPAPATRFVPWKTAQSAYITRSLALTGALNSALLHGGNSVTLGRVTLPGIDSMTCPALAIELAPERDSDKKLKFEPDNPEYQARIAGTVANALLAWRSEARQP